MAAPNLRRTAPHNIMLRPIVLALAAFTISACSTKVITTPAIGKSDRQIECIPSKITYTGNTAYLPSTISSCGNDGSALSSTYKYEISYFGTTPTTEFGAALIPTTLIGTPTGNDNITVTAKLELFQDGIRVNGYEASCEIRFYRGIFAGATDFSALRRQGLFSVKENIEQQMMDDILKLQSLP